MNFNFDCDKCGCVIKTTNPELVKCNLCGIGNLKLNSIVYDDSEKENWRKTIRNAFFLTRGLMESYMDVEEEVKLIVPLWIIGTHDFKAFSTYPRLFLNATRGSGKSRMLNFMKSLVRNGKLQASLSEAVLFRTASDSTILIDEAENINSKDKSALRELINAGYKSGNKVLRMRKTSSKDGEKQVVEEFDLFSPLAMANINGLEDVLSDRCIFLRLEKSNNKNIINMSEDFNNHIFKQLKRTFEFFNMEMNVGVRKEGIKSIYSLWNAYISTYHSIYTNTTIHTYNNIYIYNNNNNNKDTSNNIEEMFKSLGEDLGKLIPLKKMEEFDKTITPELKAVFDKIYDSGINGRNLELYMPLFLIANVIGEDVLDNLILIAKEKTQDKKEEDIISNMDMALIEFISEMEIQRIPSFISITGLLNDFRTYMNVEPSNKDINPEYIGRALKRLNLVLNKKRSAGGMQVILNIPKAKDIINKFK